MEFKALLLDNNKLCTVYSHMVYSLKYINVLELSYYNYYYYYICFVSLCGRLTFQQGVLTITSCRGSVRGLGPVPSRSVQ